MWREPQAAPLDMREASIEILDFVSGVDLAGFRGDRLRIRAVERSLGILGEATKRVPQTVRDAHPALPWRRMAGLRDVLVHDYFGVDLEIVWQVSTEEIPRVLAILEDVIAAIDSDTK